MTNDFWPRKSQSDPARAGLLDRLVDHHPNAPEEPRPQRTYTKQEFVESIIRELNRIFNTRCIVPKDKLKQRDRSVIDYGVTDFTGMNPLALDDHLTLSKAIKNAITKFEPRLQDVKVSVESKNINEKSLVVRVAGVMFMGSVREPVSFPIVVRGDSGEVHLNAE